MGRKPSFSLVLSRQVAAVFLFRTENPGGDRIFMYPDIFLTRHDPFEPEMYCHLSF
jgi:hypothetical protein